LVVVLIAAALATAGQILTAPVAGAAVAAVQTGAEATSTSGSITPTLSTASTAGTLLVAELVNDQTSSSAAFSGPTGWTSAAGVFQSGNGRVEIWYEANNPGGVRNATFTASTGTSLIAAQLSEWRGAAFSSPVDVTGTTTKSSATSVTVSSSATTTITGDLAITAYSSSVRPMTSFTAGASWAHVLDDTSHGAVADDRLGLAAASTASETETASSATSWAGVIVAFKPGCSGGSLTLNSPGSVGYPSVTLNGKNLTAGASGAFTPNDQTNSNAGWNIDGTSTTFTTGSRALPTTATQLTAASAAAATQNCSLPTNSVAYPVTLPAGATAPAAAKLYDAAANTGAGPTNVTLTFQLAVPANAYNGSYTSTWTFTIASGP
jgi:hypothetical protein